LPYQDFFRPVLCLGTRIKILPDLDRDKRSSLFSLNVGDKDKRFVTSAPVGHADRPEEELSLRQHFQKNRDMKKNSFEKERIFFSSLIWLKS
jgi:hypothetical protein